LYFIEKSNQVPASPGTGTIQDFILYLVEWKNSDEEDLECKN
jgi:hypothetical protein